MESSTLIRKIHMSCPLCGKRLMKLKRETYKYYSKRRKCNLRGKILFLLER